jgi:regulator of sigma E protease
MEIFMTIIIAIIIFGILIFVHELGHFTAAKFFGIKVHEFAIGMGPALFKKTKGDTKYSLRCLPIGGYVSLEGEDTPSDDEGAFCKKPAYARLIVLVAGAVMNIIIGFIVFVIIYAFAKQIQIPVIDKVVENSPAYVAGLMEGDRIVDINGSKVNLQSDVTYAIHKNGGKVADITVIRSGAEKTFQIEPMLDKASNLYKIGFYSTIVDVSPVLAVKSAYYNTFFVIKLVYSSLVDMVMGRVSLSDISGPVGIVNEMGKAAQSGILDILSLMALIAVNLGVMNLLPLPALDGGRIFFILIELIRRKPIKPEYEGYVHLAGLVLLLTLMVVVTYSDVLKFFTK